MATVVALDASPMSFIRSLRGAIVGARIAYPDILHVEVRDPGGDIWRLATQDASWSPSDPTQMIGRAIENAQIDARNGTLCCQLSDGSTLDVKPSVMASADAPPSWELISPRGIVLEFGPGMSWQFSGR
jgi:hypothetical protein